MSKYQVLKENPVGSGVFVSDGLPVEATDPSDDPVANADPSCISSVLESRKAAFGGCWAAAKVEA